MSFGQNAGLISLFTGLAISAGIGFLIGLEREHARKDGTNAAEFFAGIRTFPIISILGYLFMMLGQEVSIWIFALGILGILAIVTVGYYSASIRGETGSTTEFTAILTFILGGMVYLKYYELAVASAVLTTFLLALKSTLHRMVDMLSHEEIMAILQFVVISFLILPFLPDENFGPYHALNPHNIWLVVVILVSINFALYIIGKFIKPGNSLLLAGILGGLVSSTAMNWYAASQSKKQKGMESGLAVTAIVASSLMYYRMALFVYLFNPELFRVLIGPLTLAGTIGVLYSVYRSTRKDAALLKKDLPVQNPLNLKEALKFALFYSFVLVFVAFSKEHLGNTGIYISSAVSGLNDVDAITISLSRMAGEQVQFIIAASAILIAALSNTLVKYLICAIFGSSPFRKAVTSGYLMLFFTNLTALFLLLYL